MEKLSKKFVALMLTAMILVCTVVVATVDGSDRAEALALSRIEIARKPDIVEYNVGDSLVTTGMLITAIFDDGTRAGVTSGYSCYPTTLSNEGNQTITVTYSGLTATFSVIVYAADVALTTKPATTVLATLATTVPTTRPPRPTAATTIPGITVAPTTASPTTIPNITVAPTTIPDFTVAPPTTRPVVATTAVINNTYGIVILNGKNDLAYGQGTQLNVDITPANNRNFSVVWHSSNPASISVNSNGYVTAHDEGEAVISAYLVDRYGNFVYDGYGEEIHDSVIIKCTMTFWDKVVRFFRNLFSIFSF